jgi:hypothetical protein
LGGLDYVFAVVDSGVKGGVEHDASAVAFFGVRRLERRFDPSKSAELAGITCGGSDSSV